MTAPLFYLEPGRLAGVHVGQALVLDGDEGRHAVTVTRLRAGEQVLVSDGVGLVVTARIERTEAGMADLRVVQVGAEQVPGPRLVLVQALAKADRDLQAIEMATELGVDQIYPWQAQRSIVQWRAERAAKAHRKWDSQVTAAAKQARRPRIPQVGPLVDGPGVAALLAQAAAGLVLHEEAASALPSLDLPDTGEIVLVVGPEGGISSSEMEIFAAAGGQPVRLGPTVLRTSSAGPAALAVLASRWRW